MNLKGIKEYLSAPEQPVKGLLPIEWLTIGYVGLTTLLVLFFGCRMQNVAGVLALRAAAVFIVLTCVFLFRKWPLRVTKMLRVALPVALLGFWYPDLYWFSSAFPNADHVFAALEYDIFGCQPSMEFARHCTSPILSECFYMGYFFYFPMVALVLVYYFVARYDGFEKAATIILGSFFLYYIVFLFLPVAGPQYYFNAIGVEAVDGGYYPPVGLWFHDNIQMMDPPGWTDGLFYKVLAMVRESERPVASFPSSHVGVSAILMVLAYKTRSKGLMAVLTPLWIFLCCATVYIRAHYVVDVIAGFLTSFLAYYILIFFIGDKSGLCGSRMCRS